MVSPSSQRAWIEILFFGLLCFCRLVALLAEGVDRNSNSILVWLLSCVALLAEGVDRNTEMPHTLAELQNVALLAEGVDRNISVSFCSIHAVVALLAEGVDRNIDDPII